MGVTANYAFPYPALTDPPDGPSQIQDLAEAVDDTIHTGLADPTIRPLSARKTADESVTNSTTLQNDDELVLALDANAAYLMVATIFYDGNTSSGDLKYQWAVPSGAVLSLGLPSWLDTGDRSMHGPGFLAENQTLGVASSGASSWRSQTFTGTLVVGSTAGNLQFKWAQNSTNGTATHVKAGSIVALWKL